MNDDELNEKEAMKRIERLVGRLAVEQDGNPAAGFEANSMHLNKAGYNFGMLKLNERALEDIPDVFPQAISFPVNMPVWFKKEKSTDAYLVALLGSEPVIGVQVERKIMRWSIDKMVSGEGRDGGDIFDIWEWERGDD
tara:strand:- start:1 stop:414 length:414 start_codon:yes stop_codon:yes gene_type:complete